MVEFAIVLPVLAMLIVGLFSGGAAFDRKQQLTTAAREGARFGATLDAAQCSTATACTGRTWAELVRDVSVSRGNGVVAAGDVCAALVSGTGDAPVALSASHTTAGATSPCFADGSPDTGVRVQVSVRRGDRFDAVVFSRDLVLTARAVARSES